MRRVRKMILMSVVFVLTAGSQQPAYPNIISGSFSLDTSALPSSPLGPFSLAFVLIDGSGTGDGNNSVTLSGFSFGGGSAGIVDPVLSTGGQSGNMISGVSLVDSSFLNIFASSFTSGSLLSFLFSLTTNVDVGPTPDAFALVLLQGDGTAVHTCDPSGADSLLAININSAHPTILTYCSDLTPAGVVRVIPEPPSALLLAMGLLVALNSTRRAGLWRHFSGRRARPVPSESQSCLISLNIPLPRRHGAPLPRSERRLP